jgi:hypothetical protein
VVDNTRQVAKKKRIYSNRSNKPSICCHADIGLAQQHATSCTDFHHLACSGRLEGWTGEAIWIRDLVGLKNESEGVRFIKSNQN